MRFLIMLVLIAVGVLALGSYRGWFHIASDSGAGTSNVTLTVDNNKMQEDKNKVIGKAQDVERKAHGVTAH